MDSLMNVIIGLVIVAVIFIAFGAAFGTPIKYYIPQSSLEELENTGKEAVAGAKADLIGNLWFMITSFWTMIKAVFYLSTGGVGAMIYDIGGTLGVSATILGTLVGLVTLVIAFYALMRLRGN